MSGNSLNRSEARDLIYNHGRLTWDAALAAVIPAEAPKAIRYQGITGEGQGEPAQGAYWARVSMQTVDEEQETLRNGETRRFVSIGLVQIQIFVPRSSSNALGELDLIAEEVRNAYRDRQVDDNLEFTSAKIDDNVRTEPSWLNVLVTARFTYRQFI